MLSIKRVMGLFMVVALVCTLSATKASATDQDFRTVVDSRGVRVKVPANINRTVTISDGLIEGVMTVLGVQNSLVGLGSKCLQDVDTYEYESFSGGTFSLAGGTNTVTFLNPRIKELPLVADYGVAPNYETLAELKPDVVIIRMGDCSLWLEDPTSGSDNDNIKKTIEMIDSLGIPLVVLYGPNMFEVPNLFTISDEIRIIGRVFGQENRADQLAVFLESQVRLIQGRTSGVADEDRPRVLYFGLSPEARDEGGAGNTIGLDSHESFIIEQIVHARNAFKEPGSWKLISAEQVLKIDPEVIILPTDWGYHPPRELYEAPYCQKLKELKAVRNRRVASLAYTPCDCAKRLEYPLEAMIIAKTAYPERFADINLESWVLDFYQNVYDVTLPTARNLLAVQWLDWVREVK